MRDERRAASAQQRKEWGSGGRERHQVESREHAPLPPAKRFDGARSERQRASLR